MAQMQIDTQDIVIQHVAGVDVEFALSWDFDTSYMEKPVDLDAQVVVFDGSGTIVDAAFYNQLKACNGSICHSGDNRTGEGDGDDEVITVDFDTLPACVCALAVVVAAYSGGTFAAVESAACQIRAAADSDDETIVVTLANVPPHIHHLAFVVNIYSEGRNFTEVFNSYARLVGTSGKELCRYPLDATITSRGLLLAALSRTEKGEGSAAGGRWRFRAVGTMVDGRRARDADCLEDVAAVMAGKPAAVAPLVGEGALMYNPTRAPPPPPAAEAAEQQAAGKASGCNCAVS